MGILDKYLYRKLFLYLIVILPSLSAVTILVELIELFRKIKLLDIKILTLYILYKFPEKLYFMLPISIVISVVLLAKDLVKSNEIYPVLLNGISLQRLGIRIFIFSLFFSFLQIFNLEIVLPDTQKKADILYKILKKKEEKKEKKLFAFNTWIALNRNTFMYFDILDFDLKSGKNGLIIKLNKNFEPVLRIEGQRFIVKENKIIFFNGKLIDLKNLYDFRISKFSSYPFYMNMRIDKFKKLVELKKPISMKQLYETAKIAEKYGYPASYYWSRFYKKLATVFSPFILAFAIYPFVWKRKVEYMGIIILLILLYWYGMGFLSSLSEGAVVPYWSVFFIDGIYLIFGIYFLNKLRFSDF